MTDIKIGDWVTISGYGPYRVVNVGTFQRVPNRVFVADVDLWVDPQWCVKVPAPWKPEPGTVWRDKDDDVWVVNVYGIPRCVTNPPPSPEDIGPSEVVWLHGPMVELVPSSGKGDANIQMATQQGMIIRPQNWAIAQVGWQGQTGAFYRLDDPPYDDREPGGFSPVYVQIGKYVDPSDGFVPVYAPPCREIIQD